MAKGATDDPVDRRTASPGGNPNKIRLLIVAAIVVRVVAALLLLAGPWTDDGRELAGWDIERFVEIARQPERPWRDVPVEYPPGSVLVFEGLEALTSPGTEAVVGAHRALVVIALVADLGLAWVLARRHWRAGAVYLLLGLPLVPMGLLRLDVVVALLAVAAALMAVPVRPSRAQAAERPTGGSGRSTVGAAVLTAGAFMVKLWPALLISGFVAVRKERIAVAATVATTASIGLWLWWAGAGLDPVRQIVDLRGATGWHLESIGGVTIALGERVGLVDLSADEGVRLELNAYRIGTINPDVVTVGRVLAVAAIAALTLRARQLVGADPPTAGPSAGPEPRAPDTLSILGVVMLGSVAALVATAPLISPQFLLWLTPWAALMTVTPMDRLPVPVLVTAAATVLTGTVLALFGPPNLDQPPAALALAVRNGLLLYLPFSCWRWLGPTARTSGR